MSVPAILEAGSGDTAVVMLHGVGGAKEAWQSTLAALSGAGFRAIAWDMPGYGDSAMIDPYTNEGLARALETLVDATGAARIVLLGHSMGGMVAQEALALFPHKISGLILSGTSAAFGAPGGTWQQGFLQSRFAPLDAGRGMATLAAELVPAMMAPGAAAAAKVAAAAMMSRVPEAAYRAALSAIVAFDRRAGLATIEVPTLAIAGAYDTNAAPAVMQKMAARIRGCEYLCLRDVGHLANLEDPAAFDAAVLDFLQRHFT